MRRLRGRKLPPSCPMLKILVIQFPLLCHISTKEVSSLFPSRKLLVIASLFSVINHAVFPSHVYVNYSHVLSLSLSLLIFIFLLSIKAQLLLLFIINGRSREWRQKFHRKRIIYRNLPSLSLSAHSKVESVVRPMPEAPAMTAEMHKAAE